MRMVLRSLFCICAVVHIAHAEDGCPPGTIPARAGQPDDLSRCAYAPVQPAQSSGLQWKTRWGAIATDALNGKAGYAERHSSARKAKNAALAGCKTDGGKNCEVELVYENSCAAMVVGEKGYNMASAATSTMAKKMSLAKCSGADTNCNVYYSACSLPEQVQ